MSDYPIVSGSSDLRFVYGYVLAEVPDEIRIGLWRREIARFCHERGYHLALTFVDRAIPREQVPRVGFTALLDVLELPTSHAVVTPSLDHLSSKNRAVATLRRLIRRTASELIVIKGDAADVRADGA